MTDAVATGEHSEVDQGRRKFLTVATSATAAAGAVFAITPFIASWEPSERARALGAPVTVDLSKLDVGQMVTYVWRRQPIYIFKRSPQMVASLAGARRAAQGSQVQGVRPARLRAQRAPLATRGHRGADRHLHAPGVPAEAALRSGRCGARHRLAGRFPVPLPRLAL